MSPAMLRELGARWRFVQASLRADRSAQVNMRAIVPLAAPLSMASETAVAAFVDELPARCPELYSERALRRRWLNGRATFIAGAAGSAVLAGLAPSDISIIGDAAFALLAIACWSCITTIQLWRTHRLVEQILPYHGRPPPAPATHR